MSRDRVDRITGVVAEVLQPTEYELVDVELAGQQGRTIIRILIDRPGGVTLGDCARVTRLVGDRFDSDVGLGLPSHVLEVSSPGIDRPLKKPADFERFRGEVAAVTTRGQIDGRSHHLGRIEGTLGDLLVLDQPDRGRTEIPFADILKAHLKRDPWAGEKDRREKRR